MSDDVNIANEVNHSLHKRRLWLPIFVMTGISILSGSTGVQTGALTFTGIDKVGHLVVFGLLGIAWIRCFPRPGNQKYYLAVILTIGFGLLDEWHQYFNPDRYFEWGDLLADFLGAVLAGGAYHFMPRLRKFLESNLR